MKYQIEKEKTMDVFGQVVDVNTNATIEKKAGGTYQGARLTYRGIDGKVADQNFTSQTLKFNLSISNALSNLKVGDNIKITKVKEGEFWNVKQITLEDAQTVQNAAPSNGKSYAASSAAPAKAEYKSTYETPEERAVKQVYIVKQSSISSAINVLAIGAKTKPTTEEVLELANKFADFVLAKPPMYVDDIANSDINFDESEG